LEDLKQFSRTVDGPVSAKKMTEEGPYSANTYINRFGSWNEAKERAGLVQFEEGEAKSPGRKGASEEGLLEEIRRLRSELGRSPRIDDLQKHGKFSFSPYYRVFGSWNAALEEAGLEKNTERNISDRALIEHLQDLAVELGRTPKKQDLEYFGERGSQVYFDRFGSWNRALMEAGLELNRRSSISREELIDEIMGVREFLEKTPTLNEVVAHGEFSKSAYFSEFGNWEQALKSCGLEPIIHQKVEEQEAAQDLERLAQELDREPSLEDLKERGKFGRRPYVRLFGSFIDAKKAVIPDYIGQRLWREYRSTKEPFGADWPEKRGNAIERDSGKCVECGIGRKEHKDRFGRDLHVHHIVPRHEYVDHPEKSISEANKLENLVTLCQECHMKIHSKGDCFERKYLSTLSLPNSQSTC